MRRGTTALVTMTAMAVSLTACGSSSGNSTAAAGMAGGASSGTQAGAPWLQDAHQTLARLYKGTFTSAPSTPVTPPKDVNLWVVSCWQSAVGCSLPTQATVDAARALGWKTTVYDGKYTPATEAAGVEQAIAANATAIAVVDVDCANIKSALIDAKNAKIPTVSMLSADCDAPGIGGQPEFTAQVNLGQSFLDYYTTYGEDQADYIIAKSDGQAHVIDLNQQTSLVTRAIADGFAREIATCTTCKVYTVDVGATDLSGPIQQKVQTALLQHSDADWLHVPYDAMVGAIANTVKSSGRSIKMTGSEGFPATIDMIRQGTVAVTVNTIDTGWEGYALVDTIARVLAGQTEIPVSGLGYQVVDSDRNLPTTGPYRTSYDYVAAYEKDWGLR